MIKNRKKVMALALVPVLAVNLYAGSKILKLMNITEDKTGPEGITIQMVDFKDYKGVLLDSSNTMFEKLQNVYASSNKGFDEIIESEDRTSEVYASALYAKLKSAGISDEVICEEINNILSFSWTSNDLDGETWIKLFENFMLTISDKENVISYYYPLAIYVYERECELGYRVYGFDEVRMNCINLDETANQEFKNIYYASYAKDMIEASGDQKLIGQYKRIVDAGVSFEDVLDELNSIYILSQTPKCISDGVWERLFKNLLITVRKYDNVFEIYGDLAYFVHTLNCDYSHHINEYGVNSCEGLRLQYK